MENIRRTGPTKKSRDGMQLCKDDEKTTELGKEECVKG